MGDGGREDERRREGEPGEAGSGGLGQVSHGVGFRLREVAFSRSTRRRMRGWDREKKRSEKEDGSAWGGLEEEPSEVGAAEGFVVGAEVAVGALESAELFVGLAAAVLVTPGRAPSLAERPWPAGPSGRR